MAAPQYSDLNYYVSTPLTNVDWQYNFHKVVDYLTQGTWDVTLNSLTTINDVTVGGDAAVTGTLGVTGNTTLSGILTVIGACSLSIKGNFKIGTFSRDTSLASGTQQIPGVGFSPSLVLFVMGDTGGTNRFSIGLDDGTVHACISDRYAGDVDKYFLQNSYSINDQQSISDSYGGKITSLDADGFTITWNKGNGTTGTLSTLYLAFK